MAESEQKTVYQLGVFADNFQFHLQDRGNESEFPEDWNDSLLQRLFACGKAVVGVGTVRDLDCEITLEVYEEGLDEKERDEEPQLAPYDHVAQCNIELPSGQLLIGGCTTPFEETTKIDLPAGHYGVRIFWSNLESTDALGFEGDDHYLLRLYPDTAFDEIILKFWRQLALQLASQNN
jgi:hypothetical protein